MSNKDDKEEKRLGKPLVIRLYQAQRDRLDNIIRSKNKDLVNQGHPPKNSSEYIRMIFDEGLRVVESKEND